MKEASPVPVVEEGSLNENCFFYGTLRVGRVNHRLVQDKKNFVNLGTSHVRGEVKMTKHGSLPFFVEGLGLVSGDVFATNSAGLRFLDDFEGHPELYTREKVKTETGMDVWIYRGNMIQAIAGDAA